MNEFKKFDKGKLRWSLLPTESIEEVIKALQFGADKYGESSWRTGYNVTWSRYTDAIERHLAAWKNGENLDSQSRISHLAHMVCSALFLIQYQLDKVGIDNRDPRIGQVFGRLTITSFLYKTDKHRYYTAKCSCGNKIKVIYNNLTKKNTTSCGCYRLERVKKINSTHGKSSYPIYNRYRAMMARCYNKKQPHYKYYGGRGIKVSPEWHSFECFYKDMGNPPTMDSQLDRIDNNGDYCKDNCRWVTPSQNIRNSSKVSYVTYKGEKIKLIELCEKFDISIKLVRKRLKRGWDLEKAINTPTNRRKDV